MAACLPVVAPALLDSIRAARVTGAAPVPSDPDRLHDYRSLRTAAQLAFRAGEDRRARDLVERSLARSPMNAEALRVLAGAQVGHDARSLALLRAAATLSWRDGSTQGLLLVQAFLDGDDAAAVTRADALLRTQPHDNLGLAGLQTAFDSDAGRQAIARHLGDAPPWRRRFINSIQLATPIAASRMLDLFAAMGRTASPPTTKETVLAVSRLARAGYGPLALAYWRTAGRLPPDLDVASTDPDFAASYAALQGGEAALPFGWSTGEPAGVQVVGGSDGAGRTALALEADTGGADRIVSRIVVLPQGEHMLSFAASIDGQPTDRVRPDLACADGNARPGVAPGTSRSAAGYRMINFIVTIPPGCTALLESFTLRPGDDGRTHVFYLRQVRWRPAGSQRHLQVPA